MDVKGVLASFVDGANSLWLEIHQADAARVSLGSGDEPELDGRKRPRICSDELSD